MKSNFIVFVCRFIVFKHSLRYNIRAILKKSFVNRMYKFKSSNRQTEIAFLFYGRVKYYEKILLRMYILL